MPRITGRTAEPYARERRASACTCYTGAYTHAVETLLDANHPYRSSSFRIEKKGDGPPRPAGLTDDFSHPRTPVRPGCRERTAAVQATGREYEKEKVEGRESRGGR